MYSVQGGQDLQFMATKRLIVYLYTTAHFICTRTYASTGAGGGAGEGASTVT
jgi:hypothetical protein